MTIICLPCHEKFEQVDKEIMGEIWRCSICGTEISFDWDKDTVQLDRVQENGKHDLHQA